MEDNERIFCYELEDFHEELENSITQCSHCGSPIRSAIYYLELDGERQFCKKCMKEFGEELLIVGVVAVPNVRC